MLLFFLSSGLFLGWSLGANDAANVFGTAVGTRMIRFTTAAVICSVFVIIGAVVGGAGASHTLGKLGAVNALGGAFMVALSAGFTVYFMTRLSSAGLDVAGHRGRDHRLEPLLRLTDRLVGPDQDRHDLGGLPAAGGGVRHALLRRVHQSCPADSPSICCGKTRSCAGA